MTRAIGLNLAALVAVLILPTSVMAAKADRGTETSTQLWCPDLRSGGDSAYVSAWFSDRGEAFADLAYWAEPAEPGTSSMTWAGWSNDTLMSDGGASLEITFGVFGFNEGDVDDPSDLVFIGDGTLTATLTPEGDAQTERFTDQSGNHQFRSIGTFQGYEVSGTLELPTGISFPLAGCEAFRQTSDWFSNNPTSSVSHSNELTVTCGWSTDDGNVGLYASRTALGTKADLWVETADTFLYGSGSVSLSRSAFNATFDLYSKSDDGSGPAGTASASAALTSLDRVSQSEEFGGSRFSIKGVLLGVAGTLTIETGNGPRTFDMDAASCQAGSVRFSQLPGRPERPEPVDNDTPDTALALKLGDKVLLNTTGAADAPEAPCLMDDAEGGTFEGPITNTVWWRIEGTGSPITVDTAGSSFDTMVAVYVVEGSAVGGSIGCVDDVAEGVEARVTFDTASDASYFVQTGGFDGSKGDLNVLVYE